MVYFYRYIVFTVHIVNRELLESDTGTRTCDLEKSNHFERRSSLSKVGHRKKGYVSRSNATHTNARQKPQTIYINAPKTTATKVGARASRLFCGFSIAAPDDPIPPVVYIYWKLRSVELKQFSRVTSWISGSSTSAKMISTHYPNQ